VSLRNFRRPRFCITPLPRRPSLTSAQSVNATIKGASIVKLQKDIVKYYRNIG
jgi:hypothetical protein